MQCSTQVSFEQNEVTTIIVAHHRHRCNMCQVFCTQRGKQRYLTKYFNINCQGVPPFQDILYLLPEVEKAPTWDSSCHPYY